MTDTGLVHLCSDMSCLIGLHLLFYEECLWVTLALKIRKLVNVSRCVISLSYCGVQFLLPTYSSHDTFCCKWWKISMIKCNVKLHGALGMLRCTTSQRVMAAKRRLSLRVQVLEPGCNTMPTILLQHRQGGRHERVTSLQQDETLIRNATQQRFLSATE